MQMHTFTNLHTGSEYYMYFFLLKCLNDDAVMGYEVKVSEDLQIIQYTQHINGLLLCMGWRVRHFSKYIVQWPRSSSFLLPILCFCNSTGFKRSAPNLKSKWEEGQILQCWSKYSYKRDTELCKGCVGVTNASVDGHSKASIVCAGDKGKLNTYPLNTNLCSSTIKFKHLLTS